MIAVITGVWVVWAFGIGAPAGHGVRALVPSAETDGGAGAVVLTRGAA